MLLFPLLTCEVWLLLFIFSLLVFLFPGRDPWQQLSLSTVLSATNTCWIRCDVYMLNIKLRERVLICNIYNKSSVSFFNWWTCIKGSTLLLFYSFAFFQINAFLIIFIEQRKVSLPLRSLWFRLSKKVVHRVGECKQEGSLYFRDKMYMILFQKVLCERGLKQVLSSLYKPFL